MTSRMFDVPMSLISLVDTDRTWFKSKVGMTDNEMPRGSSFCSYCVLPQSPDVFVVLDALEDDRFVNIPFVKGPPYIRFYAGAPLLVSEKVKIGTLCIVDIKPRDHFSIEDKMYLVDLAANVMSLMELTITQVHARISYINATTHNLRTSICGLDLSLGYLRQTLKNTQASENYLDSLDKAQANVDVMKWTIEKAIMSATDKQPHPFF